MCIAYAAGEVFVLREEWSYVSGPAKRKDGCMGGTAVRDRDNQGKGPQDFQTEVNNEIRKRRLQGYGLALIEKDALLTLEEVLSVRLYR